MERQAEGVRVGTWNLARLQSKPRVDRALTWLREIDADLWILTETRRDVGPSHDMHMLGTVGTDRQCDEDELWVSIWSRWPIERVHGVDDPVRSVAVRVFHPDGSFLVYGTVLPWVGSQWRGLRSSAAFEAALTAQHQDWLRLRRDDPDEPLIVAGDFNQDLLESGHYYGSQRGRDILRDALASAGLIALTGGAADPVRLSSEAHATIDHVCVSNEWSCAAIGRWPAGYAPDKRVSDHFGVWVDLY